MKDRVGLKTSPSKITAAVESGNTKVVSRRRFYEKRGGKFLSEDEGSKNDKQRDRQKIPAVATSASKKPAISLMLMPVMDVRPMNVGMYDTLVDMVVLVRFCLAGLRMLMLMMFVVDMGMSMGEHRMPM